MIACVELPAKMGCVPTFRWELVVDFRVMGQAAQLLSLYLANGVLAVIAPDDPRGASKVPGDSLERLVCVDGGQKPELTDHYQP